VSHSYIEGNGTFLKGFVNNKNRAGEEKVVPRNGFEPHSLTRSKF